MLVALQLVGAVLVLAAFLAGQFRGWSPSSVRYLVLNLIGAGLLAVVAVVGRDWGFLLLEGVWAITSAASLARALGVRDERGPDEGAARPECPDEGPARSESPHETADGQARPR